jgi:hypothetical protein
MNWYKVAIFFQLAVFSTDVGASSISPTINEKSYRNEDHAEKSADYPREHEYGTEIEYFWEWDSYYQMKVAERLFPFFDRMDRGLFYLAHSKNRNQRSGHCTEYSLESSKEYFLKRKESKAKEEQDRWREMIEKQQKWWRGTANLANFVRTNFGQYTMEAANISVKTGIPLEIHDRNEIVSFILDGKDDSRRFEFEIDVGEIHEYISGCEAENIYTASEEFLRKYAR